MLSKNSVSKVISKQYFKLQEHNLSNYNFVQITVQYENELTKQVDKISGEILAIAEAISSTKSLLNFINPVINVRLWPILYTSVQQIFNSTT